MELLRVLEAGLGQESQQRVPLQRGAVRRQPEWSNLAKPGCRR